MTTLLDKIERETRLAEYSGEDKVIRASEALAAFVKDFPQQKPLKTGIPRLDRITGGMFPGQLWVVSGTTGSGKTTLCQTLSRSLADSGAYPLWFSYEVPLSDLCRAFGDDLTALQFITVPAKLKDNRVDWLQERLVESIVKFGTRACVIDHLHYLLHLGGKENISVLIGEIMRALKLLAVNEGVCLLLVCHTLKTRFDEEPGLGSARDSSFIEQEADVVLYTFRFRDDPKITVLKVAKNRRLGLVDERIPLVLVNGLYGEKVDR